MSQATTLIATVLRSLAGAVQMPELFGGKAARLAPVLETLGSIAEVPEELKPEREALLAQVQRWVDEKRPPTDQELDDFRSIRNELDERAKAALASLPPKGGTVASLLAACTLGLLGLFAAPHAQAQTPAVNVKLIWVQATSYVDGSALPSAQITGNRVSWGTCAAGAFGTKIGEHKLAPTTTDTVTGLAAGTAYCFQVFTTATAVPGATSSESDPSGVVSVMTSPVSTPKPNAPSTITVTCTNAGVTWTCTVQ